MSRYIITIQKVTVETVLTEQKWEIIGTQEIPRDASYTIAEDAAKTRITDVRGHTPQIETKKPVVREILKQEVESLDLAAVIKAVNGL
jgi:hypothetical protein